MKIYFPFAKVDVEQREVWGYASTEARDDQGEIIKRDALIAALGDYMKFANIREMHQLSAVGVAKEAAVDDRGLYVGARIVDDQAWQKVVEGVYKGYSIGGRITQRDPADFKTITGLVLNEISLVDRPANPEAIFDYWKAAGTGGMSAARLPPPSQIWACGVPEHHMAKSEAVKCQQDIAKATIDAIAPAGTAPGSIDEANSQSMGEDAYGDVEYADPGYQADGKKRYPIDNEGHIRAAWNFINQPSNARLYTLDQLDKVKSRIIAAWKEKLDEDGPPSAEVGKKAARHRSWAALTKALWDVGHIARIILDLKWLEENLAAEAPMEDDNSAEPPKWRAIIAELCSFLNAFVAEETEEVLDDSEMSGGPSEAIAADMVMMAGGASGAAFVANLCRDRSPEMQKFAAAILLRAQHNHADQALLDFAYHAVDKCIGMEGLLFAEKLHVTQAREALKAAGARMSQEQTGNATSMSQRGTAPHPDESEYDPRKRSSFTDASQSPYHLNSPVSAMVGETISKIEPGHQAFLDIGHDCIGKLTNGICCSSSKAGARHSQATLDHLVKAHDHLVAAGAKCDAKLDVDPESQATKFQPGKAATGNLAKILAGERAEKAALMAQLTDILPRLDELTKRVEDIAHAPLPPLTVAKTVTAISKQQDAAGSGYPADELAAAFARMSKEEQTLTLIKASYARPIHPPGLASGKDTRNE